MEAIVDLSEPDEPGSVDASVGPRGSLEMLSQSEIEVLLNQGQGGIHALFRKCALAVLNSGSDNDNAKELFERYAEFDVNVVRHPWGIRLEIRNAPANAFVDGQMIRGIKEHLFAVLRDVVFIVHEVHAGARFDRPRRNRAVHRRDRTRSRNRAGARAARHARARRCSARPAGRCGDCDVCDRSGRARTSAHGPAARAGRRRTHRRAGAAR